jgi:hypothetical protein
MLAAAPVFATVPPAERMTPSSPPEMLPWLVTVAGLPFSQTPVTPALTRPLLVTAPPA